MLGVVLQRWPVRRLALICPNCRRDASLANVSRGRTMLTGYLTCEGCLQTQTLPDGVLQQSRKLATGHVPLE
jgi:hypothetical protein